MEQIKKRGFKTKGSNPSTSEFSSSFLTKKIKKQPKKNPKFHNQPKLNPKNAGRKLKTPKQRYDDFVNIVLNNKCFEHFEIERWKMKTIS